MNTHKNMLKIAAGALLALGASAPLSWGDWDTTRGPTGIVQADADERYILATGDTVASLTVSGALTTAHQVTRLTPSGATLPNANFAALNKKTGTAGSPVKTSLFLDYDPDTDETAEWDIPVGATAPTAVAFDVIWTADAGTPGTHFVFWNVTQNGVANDGAWDAAGTMVSGNDTLIALGDIHVLTITGTPAEFGADEITHIQLTRDADNGSDNLSGDARIIALVARLD